MKPRKRYSKQMNQEAISRDQFEEFLHQHGWDCSLVETDIGEDLLVRIIKDGVSTGESFYVQLKSTRDISKQQLKDGRIYYAFDTDDLAHWDVQNPPVFIVIWDITQEAGWYICIDDAITTLDQKNPKWKEQGQTRVHISPTNKLDDTHLEKIHAFLLKRSEKILMEKRGMKIDAKFTFSKSEEDQIKLAQLQRHFATGERVELDGSVIAQLDFPDWWIRRHGEPNPQLTKIILGPAQPTKMVPTQIDFMSSSIGTERLGYVTTYLIQGGTEEITISNKKQNIPYEITLRLNPIQKQYTFTLNVNYGGMDMIEARKAARIQKILAQGGKILIRMLNDDFREQLPFDPNPSIKPPQELIEFIDHALIIQNATQTILHFGPSNQLFTADDFKNVREMVSIINTGTYHQKNLSARIVLNKPEVEMILPAHQAGKPLLFRQETDDSYLDILDRRFQLGPMIQHIKGLWEMPIDDIEIWLKSAEETDIMKVIMQDVNLYEEFPNWMKPKPEDEEET